MADSKKYNGSTWGHSLRKLTTATDIITSLPADLYADGNNATVGLKGNMSQTGTPTPQNPIQPQECGERTGNLFDANTVYSTYKQSDGTYRGTVNNFYTTHITPFTSDDIGKTFTFTMVVKETTSTNVRASANINGTAINGNNLSTAGITTVAFTVSSVNDYLCLGYGSGGGNTIILDNIMLNTGSTSLPYEPYGYKIPISSGQQTTNIYLGNVQTVRQIYKYVFTGEENWTNNFGASLFMVQGLLNSAPFIPQVDSLSTHYTYKPIQSGLDAGLSHGQYALQRSGTQQQYGYNIAFKNTDYTDTTDFKTFLQQQYAAGTPVTVWYVLETATTGIVNEPLRKIGDYADTVSGITVPTITGKDTFDVETSLKPSAVSLNYTGWHDATVKEWDGSQWD